MRAAESQLPSHNPPVVDAGGLGLFQRLMLIVGFLTLDTIVYAAISSTYIRIRVSSGVFIVVVASAGLFLALESIRPRGTVRQFSNDVRAAPIRWLFLAGHFRVFGVYLSLSVLLSRHPVGMPSYVVLNLAWALLIASAGFAFIPPALAWRFVRGAGHRWAWALAFGVVAAVFDISRLYSRLWSAANVLSWNPLVDLTMLLVRAVLRLFLRDVASNRAAMTIGVPRFTVMIKTGCSGLEGMGLMLVFGIAWLCFFRREFRFPRSLLLIPAGMIVIFAANAVRIAALILIGAAGAPAVALGGFHSHAGWISFNCVAVGLALVSVRLPWFASETRARAVSVRERAMRNAAAAWLVPFLAILAASMISRAASADFEWLYPLRFFAAAAALWFFRSAYSGLDWRFGWFSVLAGGLVFAIWITLDVFSGPHTDNHITSGLAALPTSGRIAWLLFRTAAAVTTVPIAEELAFRGFLIRRIISADFDSLPAREFTWISVVVSSVAFGLMHGARWPAGALAGFIYAAAFLRRGRIGDAVVAHAVTNALLAAWVLWGGRWYLW